MRRYTLQQRLRIHAKAKQLVRGHFIQDPETGLFEGSEPGGGEDEGSGGGNGGNGSSGIPSVGISTLKTHFPNIVKAAQEEYDAWHQDENGVDEELGTGGICDRVAQAIGSVLAHAGIDTHDGGQPGDEHAWIIANFKEGVYAIDIPPHVYETGGGYNWTKKPNVKISSSHIVVEKIDKPMSAEEFDKKYGEE